MSIDWKGYQVDGLYDELLLSDGHPRSHATDLVRHLGGMGEEELAARQGAAELSISIHHREPAPNREHLSGDISCALAHQEGDRRADIVRFAKTPERNATNDLLRHLRIHDRGLDGTGRNAIHRHARPSELLRQALREGEQPSFRARVDGESRGTR